MPYTFEQSKDDIARLVKHFAINREQYNASDYKEAQARQEFIDPMFAALGWDVSNSQGAAPNYREVVVEDSLEVMGQKKAPDYVFRVGRERKFFAEAKKPGIDLKSSAAPAYQLRRYAWTAKLPLSLLTDFDELAVYDCLIRPSDTDKASVARVSYLTFTEYPDRWREVWDVFSREAVWGGSFDQYAATGKAKRGTSTVDVEFLKEIEGWREALAHNLALRNPHLTVDELCDSVQRTIDRIIFLRMAEDRGIEEYARLQRLVETEGVYRHLMQLFRLADKRYNSGLFDFSKSGDRLTPSLNLDDKTMKSVLADLYFPQSPYEFSVLPVEILGNVYEQFLGKVIRLTLGHQARMEEKPETKKAGGVYYTPAYIVNYIVKSTVGSMVEGRSPDQLKGFRVLDPACGSGSFLLGAYQFLLDHYSRWYATNCPEKHKKEVYRIQGPGPDSADWHLTSTEKKRILTEHIFGVDIDRQAVEVTKLSLLLKVLESETGITLTQQLTLLPTEVQERALPNLDQNIKCGNSLIGPDYFSGQMMADAEELRRVNPFDWSHEFHGAIHAGGFDCVIGNPPWLMAGYYITNDLEYLRAKFTTATGKFDLYYLFVERGLNLLSNGGLFGMVVPNKYFHTKAASNLRSLLSSSRGVRAIVDFGDAKIFPGATNYSSLLILQKQPAKTAKYIKARADLSSIEEMDVGLSALSAHAWHFEAKRTNQLFEKVETAGVPLENTTTRFGTGVQSGADKLLVVDPATARSLQLERDLLHPIYRGRDVRRYVVAKDLKYLVFPYVVRGDEFVILPEAELQKHRKLFSYLMANKQKLEQRVWFGRSAEELTGHWYGMMYLDSYKAFSSPHLLTPSLANRSNFALGTGDLFVTGTAGVTSIIPKDEGKETLFYLLAVLNSRLMSFYTTGHSPVFSGGYYKFSAPYLRKLPIRRINFTEPADRVKHDKITALVEQILDLHKELASIPDAGEKERLERLIASTDQQIEALVYELYGLSEDEIAIVETTNDLHRANVEKV